jgi:hypothetical protein
VLVSWLMPQNATRTMVRSVWSSQRGEEGRPVRGRPDGPWLVVLSKARPRAAAADLVGKPDLFRRELTAAAELLSIRMVVHIRR